MPELYCLKTQENSGSWVELRQNLAVFHIFLHETCRQLCRSLQLIAAELALILTGTDPQLFLKLLTQVQC